jgi:hypothetical protein
MYSKMSFRFSVSILSVGMALVQLIPSLISGACLLSYSFAFSIMSPVGVIQCVAFVYDFSIAIVQCNVLSFGHIMCDLLIFIAVLPVVGIYDSPVLFIDI